jgi:hypothetical protein
MNRKFIFNCLFLLLVTLPELTGKDSPSFEFYTFGEGGQNKMMYDRRQRPGAVYLDGRVFIAFNAGSDEAAKKRAPTQPMVIAYDPDTHRFSESVILGPTSTDHHHGPVIWADTKNILHTLSGCHKTPGLHLVAREAETIGSSLADWKYGWGLAPMISYPSIWRISSDRQLIYYRTGQHPSSWTYRISKDNGKTWEAPEHDVVDLDSADRFEWSSYHTVRPDPTGRFLHVAFMAYDDNRADDPKRSYNSRYDSDLSHLSIKYNLYYIKIDLQSQAVTNYLGQSLKTPIHLDQADVECRIWDTGWRGAGVPPDIEFDQNDQPVFLQGLSGKTPEEYNYHFVRLINGKWKSTPITSSTHRWNSGHLRRTQDGAYHAYLLVGDGLLNTGGDMDRYGGGRIEEWISKDQGNNWRRHRDLTPGKREFPGWKFNNIQPVTHPDGSVVEGMLLFYGWKDKDAPKARGFLMQNL